MFNKGETGKKWGRKPLFKQLSEDESDIVLHKIKFRDATKNLVARPIDIFRLSRWVQFVVGTATKLALKLVHVGRCPQSVEHFR